MLLAWCWIQCVSEPSLPRCPYHLLLLTGPHPDVSHFTTSACLMIPGWPTASIAPTALAPLLLLGLLPAWECMAEADDKVSEKT